tara:strand:- start:88 stop:1446 length:1359 start_codon:yes stop_codon:yes gene_type:complete
MKQLLFLILFPFFIFSQSTIIKDSDKIIKTIISKEENKVHIFYNDKVSTINLNTLKSKDTVFDYKGIDIKWLKFVNSLSKNYFLDPLGGGVFLFENYSLSKIDNSFKHKMQIESSQFIYKENIYKYGGYGFWSDRNFITRFDLKTNEWELVPFSKSKTVPEGRHKSIIKVIGDTLYVIGGISLNEFNPLVFENNNEVWKFDLVNGIWERLGEMKGWSEKLLNYPIIDFEDKLIIDNKDEDVLYEIDIIKNTVRLFNRTSFTRKVNNASLPMFFYKGEFYGFFKEDNSLNQITLVKRNSDEIFGKLISEDRFYENEINFINYILSIFGFLLLIPISILIYKRRLIKNKLIIKKDGKLYFNTKKIDLEDQGLVMLKYLMTSKEPVYSKDIISLINKPQMEYSHKTRILNDTLYKINYKIKSSLKIDYDPITVIKSSFDKRLKVYSINKNLFVKS